MLRFSNIKRGFTLIEVLVVISLVGVLSGILVTVINPTRLQNESKDATAHSTLSNLAQQIQNYRTIEGLYPTDSNGNSNILDDGLGNYVNSWPNNTPPGASYSYASDSDSFAVKVDLFSKSGCYVYCSNTGSITEYTSAACASVDADCNVVAAAATPTVSPTITVSPTTSPSPTITASPTSSPTFAVSGMPTTTCLDPTLINFNIECPGNYQPVCGCDGVSYFNECVARNHSGVTTWSNDICDSSPAPTPLPSGLLATYYDNDDLTGLKAQQVDSQVYFNWGWNRPNPNIDSDTFSTVWEGYVTPDFTENYTFYFWGTDGARLWVNGQPIFNKWQLNGQAVPPYGPKEEYSGSISLTSGQAVPIRLEYFQWCSGANIDLRWSSASVSKQTIPSSKFTRMKSPQPFAPPILVTPTLTPGNGLRGDYYDGMNFNTLRFSRRDPVIDFTWGCGGNDRPDLTLWSDEFSVRWSGFIRAPYTGSVTFHTLSDEGVRLRVNNTTIINELHNSDSVPFSGSINLVQNQWYPILLEYFEWVSQAEVHLSWSYPGQSQIIIPTSYMSF